jgi:undecaprenyl-diphosphatase
MNAFDFYIITWLNHWARHWPALDRTVVYINDCDLFKGAVVMSMFWWAWFHGTSEQRVRNREICGVAFIGCHISLYLARVLQNVTPFRMRPMLNPELKFVPPVSLPDASNWNSWNSFPSDHAALFFALATGVFLVTRRAGGWLLAYIAVFIVLARIFTGLHYPTDFVAGGLLGGGLVLMLSAPQIRRWVARPVLKWHDAHCSSFYAVAFFLSYQVATLFYDLRMILWRLGFTV